MDCTIVSDAGFANRMDVERTVPPLPEEREKARPRGEVLDDVGIFARLREEVREVSLSRRAKHFLPINFSARLALGILMAMMLVMTGCSNKAEEAKLQQDEQELADLRQQNEQLKGKPDDTVELTRLRNDHDELLQLRNQVKQLQDQNKALTAQLQAAQSQRGQAQQQQQQSSQELETLRTQTQQMQQEQAQAHTATCINNLRMIDGAKQTWALEYKKPANATPTVEDLLPYFIGNQMPVCPDGGTYSINALSVPPTCSVPGHVLPK